MCLLPDTQNPHATSPRQACGHGRDRHPPFTSYPLAGAPAWAPSCLGTPVPSDPAAAAHTSQATLVLPAGS